MLVPDLYFFIQVASTATAEAFDLDVSAMGLQEQAFVELDPEARRKLTRVSTAIDRIEAAVGREHAMVVGSSGATFLIAFRETPEIDAFEREKLEALVTRTTTEALEGEVKLRANATSADPQRLTAVVPNGKIVNLLRSTVVKSDGNQLIIGAVVGTQTTIFPQTQPTDFTEPGSTELLRKHGPHPVIGFCCGMKGGPDLLILASGDRVAIPTGFPYSLLDIVESIREKPHLLGDITRLSGDSIWNVTVDTELVMRPLQAEMTV